MSKESFASVPTEGFAAFGAEMSTGVWGSIDMASHGLGKSMIALNIAHEAVLAGYSVIFTTAAQMLLDLGSRDSIRDLERRLKIYAKASLLVIDEVGYLSFAAQNKPRIEVFTRQTDGAWMLRTYGPGDRVELSDIDVDAASSGASGCARDSFEFLFAFESSGGIVCHARRRFGWQRPESQCKPWRQNTFRREYDGFCFSRRTFFEFDQKLCPWFARDLHRPVCREWNGVDRRELVIYVDLHVTWSDEQFCLDKRRRSSVDRRRRRRRGQRSNGGRSRGWRGLGRFSRRCRILRGTVAVGTWELLRTK